MEDRGRSSHLFWCTHSLCKVYMKTSNSLNYIIHKSNTQLSQQIANLMISALLERTIYLRRFLWYTQLIHCHRHWQASSSRKTTLLGRPLTLFLHKCWNKHLDGQLSSLPAACFCLVILWDEAIKWEHFDRKMSLSMKVNASGLPFLCIYIYHSSFLQQGIWMAHFKIFSHCHYSFN